jgi:hypothetical protein
VKRAAFLFTSGLALASACGHIDVIDDRRCPCADGYTCCASIGRCTANGTACPADDAAAAPDAPADAGASRSCADPPVAFVRSNVAEWFAEGTDPGDYDFDLTPAVRFERLPTAHINSKLPNYPTDLEQFATYDTSIDAKPYRGTTLRFSAIVRGAAVKGDGALYLRADRPGDAGSVIDNMRGREIHGDAEWNRYQVTVDVPSDALIAAFGLWIGAAGNVWASDPRLEIVSTRQRYAPDPTAWVVAGSASSDYTIGLDSAVAPCGRPTGHVASLAPAPSGDGVLMQSVAAEPYRAQRVLLSGFVRAAKLEHGGLWMKVQDQAGNVLASDSMDARPIVGTTDFTRAEIVLDVPANATSIFFGLRSKGVGEAWVDGVTLEAVDKSRPTTN